MSKFGNRLRFLRESNKILNKDFAKIMNVEPATVTRWEKGIRFPKEDVLVKIADYFSCSVDYLLGRTDNPSAVVYNAKYNNQDIEIEIHKDFPRKLAKDDIATLIRELENIGINIDRIIEKSKDKKD